MDGRVTLETMPSPGVSDSVSVGSSAVQVGNAAHLIFPIQKGVEIRAASTNSALVYVGFTAAITTTGNAGAGTDGFELAAGQSVFIQIATLNKLYFIAGASSQLINYLAQ